MMCSVHKNQEINVSGTKNDKSVIMSKGDVATP